MRRSRNYAPRRYVSKDTHDRCLRVAIDHKAKLTQHEYFVLNHVAAMAASNFSVLESDIDEIDSILARFK
jgi:hypothetical protein